MNQSSTNAGATDFHGHEALTSSLARLEKALYQRALREAKSPEAISSASGCFGREDPYLWAINGEATAFFVCMPTGGMNSIPITAREVRKHVVEGRWDPESVLLKRKDGAGTWITAAALGIKIPPDAIPHVDRIPREMRVGPNIPGTIVPWLTLDRLAGPSRESLARTASAASHFYKGIVDDHWSDEKIGDEIARMLATFPEEGSPLCLSEVQKAMLPIPYHIAYGKDLIKRMRFDVDNLVRGVNHYPTHAPPESVLAGDEWFRRSDIFFLNSSAGAGKSVVAFQLAIAWGLGLPYLGIAPSRPLRILHFSGEDDEVTAGQCREGLLAHAEALFGRPLTKDDLSRLDEMLRTEHRQCRTGNEFVAHLDKLLRQEPADLVIINPLMSFVSGDIVAEVKDFLREQLTPVAVEHDCGILIMHHTVKLRKNGWDDIDPIYSGLGGAEPANVGRSILCLAPTSAPGLHVLHVGKRDTTGWVDADGEFAKKAYFKRSNQPKRPAWLPVPHAEAEEMISGAKAAGGAPRKCSPERIAEILREKGGRAWRADLLAWTIDVCGCSEATAKKALREARDAGMISEISKKPEGKGQTRTLFFLPDIGPGEPG